MKIVSCNQNKNAMNKFLKFLPLILLISLVSCKKDDNKSKAEPPRDRGEVYQENKLEIQEFLETHFYYLAPNPYSPEVTTVRFDTIAGDNSGETPLIDSDKLKSKTVTSGDIDYKVYYLQVEKGAEETYQPTFADKIVLTYQARTFADDLFDEAISPLVVDLPQTSSRIFTIGTVKAITEFKGASDFSENSDGTISYDDNFGIGAVFMPSGLGYFQSPPISSSLEPYAPYIITFQLYNAIQMDHDGDGIPSYMEDLNDNGFLGDDDTDKNGVPNFLDPDDDGDGVPTRDEIIINEPEDGIITPDDIEFPDSDNSGIPDYLDPNI